MIKRNVAYNFIYQVFTYIIPLVTTPYLSRVLGASGVGEYSFAYSVVSYFSLFAVLGLANYGNREISRVSHIDGKRKKTFWEIYSMQFLTGLIAFMAYNIYAFCLTKPTLIKSVMAIYLLSSVFDISWFYFGMELFKVTILRNTILKIISCILIFALVKGDGDAWIYGSIISISGLLSQVVLWLHIGQYVGRPIISLRGIKNRIVPNVKLFVPVIAVSIYKIMDKIMLGIYSNNQQVGFYESSERLISIPVCFVTALGTVMLPRVSNMISKGEKDEAQILTEKSLIISIVSSSLIAFGMLGVLDEFIPLFFGSGYEECKSILMLLLPSTIFVAQANVIRTQILIPYGQDNIYITAVVFGAVSNLLSNIIFIPKFGAVGASIGTLLSEIMVWLLQNIFVAKHVKPFSAFIKSLPVILLGVVMMRVIDTLKIGIDSLIVIIVVKAAIGFAVFVTPLIMYFVFINRRKA